MRRGRPSRDRCRSPSPLGRDAVASALARVVCCARADCRRHASESGAVTRRRTPPGAVAGSEAERGDRPSGAASGQWVRRPRRRRSGAGRRACQSSSSAPASAIRCWASSAPNVWPPIRSTTAVPARPAAAMPHGQASPADSAGRIAPTANAMASARSNEPSSWAACAPASWSCPRISSGTVTASCAEGDDDQRRPARPPGQPAARPGRGNGRQHPRRSGRDPGTSRRAVHAGSPRAPAAARPGRRRSRPGAPPVRHRARRGPHRRSGPRSPHGLCRIPCLTSAR